MLVRVFAAAMVAKKNSRAIPAIKSDIKSFTAHEARSAPRGEKTPYGSVDPVRLHIKYVMNRGESHVHLANGAFSRER